jgi:DEAD/DEAH box helicase domain-containing protein
MHPFVAHLRRHPTLGARIAHHRRLPGRRARFATPAAPLPEEIRRALSVTGIDRLWSHQAAAVDLARAGRNVVAVTPTASGKTLVFALPVLERLLEEPQARALFLYPTKALAQDQVQALRELAAATGRIRPPRFDVYDGDTPDALRRKIRKDPPEVLVTNPDMLHLGILAHHDEWDAFLRGLRFVVLDELHVYRGVFGAHVHHILRRLKRAAAARGASPRFVASSATVGNAGEFAETLVGEPFAVVDRSGAPMAAREFVILQPGAVSPYTLAVRLLAEAAAADLRSIAFTKARRVAELVHQWLAREHPELRRKIAPYRAGYLPEERREIEKRLFRGDLLAVVSTSALELGVDVGGLDLCVLVGYPGSRTSTWQRIGRVGRSGRDAVVVWIALPDALDQYLVAHPDLFFDGAFERAVLDPWNPTVASAHLVCAAAERPLELEEIDAAGPQARAVVDALTREGRLATDVEGRRWHALARRPQRDVSPRSAGSPFAIHARGSSRPLGTIDAMRVHHECHPGAIYLHAGETYRVLVLDADARRVDVEPARVDYYTVVLGEKETEILETRARRPLEGARSIEAGFGRLRVTVRIRGYQKKRIFDGEPIATHPLDVPPLVFETTGLWIELPDSLPAALAGEGRHFMGGIHAVEHAMIGLFPLLAIADRGDVGGISYVRHPQTGGPAIFLYDGMPGGAGLAERAFRDLEELLGRTSEHVEACPCEEGCPLCIQSPRCGNGNKPLDKGAAERVLRIVRGEEPVPEGAAAPAPPPDPPARPVRKHGITRAGNLPDIPAGTPGASGSTLVLDLETQRSAEEVGGWGNARKMGLALAVVWDSTRDEYRTYFEADVDRLLLDLALADRVVGFNIERFDLVVLGAYTERDLSRIRTLDLLSEIHARLGFRLSLAHLSEVNFGESKSGDGLQSLRWWKEGRLDLIETYCRKDVEMTRRLWELGRDRGYLLYRGRAGDVLRLPVGWGP